MQKSAEFLDELHDQYVTMRPSNGFNQSTLDRNFTSVRLLETELKISAVFKEGWRGLNHVYMYCGSTPGPL